jgi:hypothetical protein
MPEPLTMCTHAEVSGFFDGLDLVKPGVVQPHRWRPCPESPVPDHDIANDGGGGPRGAAEVTRR